jgi:hypothetical protein
MVAEMESKGSMSEYNSDEERKNERISQLLNELYSLTDFEGILTQSLEGDHISSSGIIYMAECYEPPVDFTDYDEERCIDTIDSALEKMTEGLSDADKMLNIKDVLPPISDVMEVIKKYYEDDDILDTFDSWKVFDFVEDSWEMDEHNEKIRSEYEHDLNEEVADIEEEEKRSILDVLENGSPDELWSLLADYGMCSNYDYEGIKRAFEKLVEKLKNSNYNQEGVI